MTDYSQMAPMERFALVDRLATQLWQTKRWKTEFARTYGITTQSIAAWKHNGAPEWACQALTDALRAQGLDTIIEAVDRLR